MPRLATPCQSPLLTAACQEQAKGKRQKAKDPTRPLPGWHWLCQCVCVGHHWLRQCFSRRLQPAYAVSPTLAKPVPHKRAKGELRRHGFTLVEVLVSLSLALVLLAAVVTVFGRVGGSINNVRAALEQFDRLREAEQRLHMDLDGATVTPIPPRRGDDGYFEYIEKSPSTTVSGAVPPYLMVPAKDTLASPAITDTTVNQHNDVLMFTTRTKGMPFVGRYLTPAGASSTLQSDTAEVAWYVRGRTLHRRVLLVAPGIPLNSTTPFYAGNDISVRVSSGTFVANTLGDLTKRENRYAHPNDAFPYDASRWGQHGLPTVCEAAWANISAPSATALWPITTEDLWSPNASGHWLTDWALCSTATVCPSPPPARVADDVILTNVIGFDVKAWDPTQKSYVDLGYNGSAVTSANIRSYPLLLSGLSHLGHPRSGLAASSGTAARTYDTYSFHYEVDPTIPAPFSGYSPGRAANGFDDDGNGQVDDIVYDPAPLISRVSGGTDLMTLGENQTAPPYPIPLRGIQVKIRIFEPDSRQIREITVTHDFLPK